MTVAFPSLVADCARCAALCCVAFAFDQGEDFAFDKPALTACPNLGGDFTCTIHAQLDGAGFGGCVRYDCLGAGQRVTQEVFAGANWRDQPDLMAPMAEAFATLRQIHSALELLGAARALPLPPATRTDLETLITLHAPTEGWTPETLTAFALSDAPKRVTPLLRSLRAHL